MKTTFLEFEQPIAELEAKIDELRYVQDDSALDISEEIARLQKKSQALTREIYGKLSAWQIAQVARPALMPLRQKVLDRITEALDADAQLVIRHRAAIAQRRAVQFVGIVPSFERKILED